MDTPGTAGGGTAAGGAAAVAPDPDGGADEPGRLAVPPWVQLVGLPLIVLGIWLFATAASHAIIVFLIASLISLLLSPIVRSMSSVGMPRPLAVLFVFSVFSLVVITLALLTINLITTQAVQVREDLPVYVDRTTDQLDRAQRLLDRRDINVDLRDQGVRFLRQIEERSSEVSTRALEFGTEFVQILAETIFNVVLIVVITVYMLLDAPRLARRAGEWFPARANIHILFKRLEQSLMRYVRGQVAASAVMGISATVGLWIIGATGIWPPAMDLAIIFGVIVGITEFAPSIGPVLGSIPPIMAALFDGLVPALVVTAFFVVLHQIEGHYVIPKLMGAAIAVHPLLVIFGIVAGAQIFGFAGVILVLPLLAVGREIVMFVRERVELGHWPETMAPTLVLGVPGAGTVVDEPDAAAVAADVESAEQPQPSGPSRAGRFRDRIAAARRRRRGDR